MLSAEIREKFRKFFEENGHKIVPSSSLIPDDPSVLLTTAGMQQFKPYFVGKADPMKDFGSQNTASIQKCFRTSDIDEVGDESHLTFFEMLGNFSFGGSSPRRSELRPREGGYFKEEAIKYGYEFITKELGLKIDYVSVFEGDSEVPKDKESEKIWRSLGVTEIKYAGRKDNFWGPTGSEGPCGPTTEIYINGTEIWNIVFNEYYMCSDRTLEPLKQKGVDTGMGLERLAMVSQGVPTIFETDLFKSLVAMTPDKLPVRIRRIIADHARGAVFLISEGVRPSNKDAGYILRRLLRRIVTYAYKEDIGAMPQNMFKCVVDLYKGHPDYKNLDLDTVNKIFGEEYEKFIKTVGRGLKELESLDRVDAKTAFGLYQSFGLPYETIKETGGKKAQDLTREDFDKEFSKHQEISRAGQEKKFGGHGLILDTGELKAGSEEELNKVLRLHTATHLLQRALREVLGPEVHQMGSDITAERTRFDFSFPRKMTEEEKKKVENLVNEKIKEDLPMQFVELPKDEAVKIGALHFFKEKYPDKVKVYYVGKDLESAWSKEFCGGPHVTHTGIIGKFKIAKEEAVGAGTRRVRGVIDF